MNDHASTAVLTTTSAPAAIDGAQWYETGSLGSPLDAETETDVSAAGGSDDPVIRSLSRALEAAEQGRDQTCMETLRGAIAARLANLQSAISAAGSNVQFALGGRQVRALQKWRLKRVVEYVDDHLAEKIGLLDLAAVAGLSRMHFASQFRAATGLRPHEFLLRRRIRRAEDLLQNSTMAIVEIALSVGFQTQAHFTTVFKRFVGCTPRQWRAASQPPSVPSIRHRTQVEIASAI